MKFNKNVQVYPSFFNNPCFHENRGFTLIELLIVLIIIGIGFMSVTPKIFENTVEPNKRVQFFNNLLEKYGKAAQKVNHPIAVKGYKSSSKFVVDETELLKMEDNVTISTNKKEVEYFVPNDSGITSVEINGKKSFSNEFEIYIYPDKLCDHFIINFNDDKSIESIPLLLNVREN